MILNLTERAIDQYYSLLTVIRKAGKVVDLYPNQTKMDKQLTYADKAGYTHAILIGEEELANNQVQIKNLKERKQESVEFEKAVFKIWGKNLWTKSTLFSFSFSYFYIKSNC